MGAVVINVALVGFGYWGPNLLRNFAHNPDCGSLVCCDKDLDRLARAKQLHPAVETTPDFREILDSESIDAVAIATPAQTHYALAREALLHGKHTLVEKPLAMSSAEGRELVALARERNLTLMVGHTFMYSPALLKMKELSGPEYLGDIYYLYTHRVNLGQVRTNINALWSIAPHDVSIALFLTDQTPVSVSARGTCFLNPGIEDVVFLTLGFADGVMAHIHVSWIDPSKARKVTLVGSKRMITYDDLADEGKVKVYDKGVTRIGNAADYEGFHYRVHSGDILAPCIKMSEPLAEECTHFIRCVRTGERPLSDGENGLAVIRVLEAAQQSLEGCGQPVMLRREEAAMALFSE